MAITAVGKWFSSGDVVDTTNIQPQTWGPLLGLQIIALGTGGIKPCVSSFGGDQFLNSEVRPALFEPIVRSNFRNILRLNDFPISIHRH